MLSERNLLALLTKLYTPGSHAAIETSNTLGEAGRIRIRAERDDVHYADRLGPPGVMHPVTERILREIQRIVQEEELEITPAL